MRGEFIQVWSETWREIWLPLLDSQLGENQDGIPEDIFCDLYRELTPALRDLSEEAAIDLVLTDGILLREAFENAVQLAKPDTARSAVEAAFESSNTTECEDGDLKRRAAEAALIRIVGESGSTRFAEAVAALAKDSGKRSEAKERAVDRLINDPGKSREAFRKVMPSDIAGERALVPFLEGIYEVAEEFGGEELSNRYFNLLTAFIEKFSLRYDLRRPCILCPTLAGLFTSLMRDLRSLSAQDAHLDALMKDFESAVRDLRSDCSDSRIKTCIQKQVNFLEAIGRSVPGVTGTTLGAICDQVGTWPHDKLKAAMKDLYGFASDYPGIRHGGTPANARRSVDMRDLLALSILLAGFTPYLSHGLDPDAIYRGT